MTMIIRDVMLGNEKLDAMGFKEEALGRNGLFGGFQGQRMWTDYQPNGDFTEAILNSSFDWHGKRQPTVFATENDNLNGLSMLFGNLLTGKASGFSDVRCYWSPEAVERVTGWKPEGDAKDGFIHLINSGSTCLDATGKSTDADGNGVMKSWWQMEEKDIDRLPWCNGLVSGRALSVPRWRIFLSFPNRCENAADDGACQPGRWYRSGTADRRGLEHRITGGRS